MSTRGIRPPAIRLRWVLALALLAPGVAAQQQPRVEVSLQPRSGITEIDPIRLTVTIEGTDRPPAVRLPKLVNLKLIGGPSTSTQVRSDFRTTRRLVSLTWTLLAEGPGAAEIPSIEVPLGATVLRTEPIRFEVAPAAAGSGAAPGAPGAPGEGAGDGADVVLRARLGTEEVWVGEPVPLSVELYTGARVASPDWREVPSFPKFWVETDEVDPDAESYRATLGGRRYVVYPLERKLLVPQSPGEYTIDPFVLQLEVRASGARDDFFDFFSFGRTRTIIRKTEPLGLRVRPLPTANVPGGFGGAVGTFSMNVELDRREVAVDEGVALRVTIEGNGFLKPVKAPELAAPPDLRIFPPKATESQRARGGKMLSKKTWEWVLVPLAAGELTLPEIRFAYFDTADGRYRVASSDPLTLVVKRGAAGASAIAETRGDVRLERRDIAFIKTRRGPLAEGSPRIHQQGLFRFLLVLPLLLLPLVILAGRRQARLQSNRGLARSRKARARARKRLAAARRRLSQVDSGTFHEQVARTLVEYAADRFDRPAAGLTYDKLDELLASRQVDAELARSFRNCLENCDFARFVPAAGQAERRRETLDQAAELVERLERAL